jgi:hypothetical protein
MSPKFRILYGFQSQDEDDRNVIYSTIHKNTKYEDFTVAFELFHQNYVSNPWYGFECDISPAGSLTLSENKKEKLAAIATEYWRYYNIPKQQREIKYIVGFSPEGYEFVSTDNNIPIWEKN